MSYLDFVYMGNPEGESLTSMTICAGWTVTGTTVRRRCPSEDTWKKLETLKNRVSDNQNGCAGRTVAGITVRRMWPVVDTWRKIGQWSIREIGMDPMTVRPEYDGLSSGSCSVTQG